ncbi:MAG: hypothetical protein HQ564_01620 [Candidatus Saganbacteria bacterium]|nr:hypothetical protein [Candidatus Saganbacteria bacterium]
MADKYNKKDIPPLITYHYVFEPDGGPKKEFLVKLDGTTLDRIDEKKTNPPDWCELEYQQCKNCPFDSKKQKYCPLACGLISLINNFKDTVSHHVGQVTVTTAERTISKRTAMQDGISSLIGIYMVTSNCPVMEKLKPMVRYHLPFASISETIYRATSMYLLGQYFVNKQNKKPDWDLAGLVSIYKEVAKVNHEICERIRAASNEDANANALVILDIFAKMLPFSIEATLKKLEYLFDAYLK